MNNKHTMVNHLLSTERIEIINSQVEELLVQYKDSKNSSDVLNKLIKDNGIQLKELDLMELSGVLFKSEGEQWNLLVNKMDSTARKLFTIAHELGHFYLHRNNENQFIDGELVRARNENTRFDEYELEANEFAGNLLMPKKEIEQKLQSRDIVVDLKKIKELSEQFLVSTFAIQTRLKNLDYKILQNG